MTHVESAEVAGGRLGAVLSASRTPGPVFLAPDGPWLATTLDQARRVLADPATFDFPGNVSRGSDLSGSIADTRSGHHVYAALRPEDVARGMAVFVAEWDLAVADAAGDRLSTSGATVDLMDLLRRPVARSTCAAVLPDAARDDRTTIADQVLAWIDALAPVISAPRPPHRWSRARRRELRARIALEQSIETSGCVDETSRVLATMLAAGVQVPIAAGAWLLVRLAAHPGVDVDPDHAVWETLRLSPPTWITARLAVRDVRLGEAEVPGGSLVFVSPLLLGRLTELVPGTDEGLRAFDPTRWATGEMRPGAWLPFGAGPHACPGRTLGFAMLRHLAAWSGDHDIVLAAPVRHDQGRGIAPDPALVTIRSEEGAR